MLSSFFEIFDKMAQEEPDAACFELFGGQNSTRLLTFGGLRARIAATARMYGEEGIQSGDVVLIFGQHSEGKLAAFFGAQWIGAIPSFMPPPTIKQNPDAWAESHAQLIARIKPKLVVSEPVCIPHVKGLGVDRVVSTTEIEELDVSVGLKRQEVDLDDIAFLQHSSGTTGLKKGVAVTYRQLESQVDMYGDVVGIDARSNVVSWLPIYHDMGLIAATLLPMRRGASIRLIDTFTWLARPDLLIELLAKYPRGYCWLPNFAFNYLAKRSRIALSPSELSKVAAVINCSEPCKMEDMEAFIARFEPAGLPIGAVQICYAAAEYVFAMTQTHLGTPLAALLVDAELFDEEQKVVRVDEACKRSRRLVSVGSPVAGAELRIGDGLPDGQVGEVIVRGPSMCDGYFRNEEMTRLKFVNGWYHTGDLGFLHEGMLYVSGRKDDVIIVRGKNIYAHDIEAIASRADGVKSGRVVAFGIDDPSGSQQLVLAVEATGERDVKALKIDVNERVNSAFGVTLGDVAVVGLNTLVKTTSGKISRYDNRNKYLSRSLETVS